MSQNKTRDEHLAHGRLNYRTEDAAQRYATSMTNTETPTMESLKATAAAQVAQYPQYAGHFERYTLGRIKRDVRTKAGLAFTAGEVVLVSPPSLHFVDTPRSVTVWSMRNAVDTSVSASDVEELAEVTAETVTPAQLQELLEATGGVWIAGKECCALALGSELERAKDSGDESYYSARMDQHQALDICAAAINARAKGGR